MVICSIFLTRYWYAYPDSFPPLLKWLGNRLISSLGVEHADAAADVELVYMLTVSALFGVALFVGGSHLARLMRRRCDETLE
jgi:hypothetical protein